MLKFEWQNVHCPRVESTIQSTINEILSDIPFTVLDSINSHLDALLKSPDSGLPKQLLAFKPSLSPISGIVLSQLSLGAAPPTISIPTILPATPSLLNLLFSSKYPTVPQSALSIALLEHHLQQRSNSSQFQSITPFTATPSIPPSHSDILSLHSVTSAAHHQHQHRNSLSPALLQFISTYVPPLHTSLKIPSLPRWLTHGFTLAQQSFHIHTLYSHPSLLTPYPSSFSPPLTSCDNDANSQAFGTGLTSLSIKIVPKSRNSQPNHAPSTAPTTPLVVLPTQPPSTLTSNFFENKAHQQFCDLSNISKLGENGFSNQFKVGTDSSVANVQHYPSSSALMSTLQVKQKSDFVGSTQRYGAVVTGLGMEQTTGFIPSTQQQQSQSSQSQTQEDESLRPIKPTSTPRSALALLSTFSTTTPTPIHIVPTAFTNSSSLSSSSPPPPPPSHQSTNLSNPYLLVQLSQTVPTTGTLSQVDAFLSTYPQPFQSHPLSATNPAPFPLSDPSTPSLRSNSVANSTPNFPLSTSSSSSSSSTDIFNLDSIFVIEVDYSPEQSLACTLNTTLQLQNPIQIMAQGINTAQYTQPLSQSIGEESDKGKDAQNSHKSDKYDQIGPTTPQIDKSGPGCEASDVLSPLPPQLHSNSSKTTKNDEKGSENEGMWAYLTRWFSPAPPSKDSQADKSSTKDSSSGNKSSSNSTSNHTFASPFDQFLKPTGPKSNRRSSMASKRWQAPDPFSALDVTSQTRNHSTLSTTSTGMNFVTNPTRTDGHNTTFDQFGQFDGKMGSNLHASMLPINSSLNTPQYSYSPYDQVSQLPHHSTSTPHHKFLESYSPILKPAQVQQSQPPTPTFNAHRNNFTTAHNSSSPHATNQNLYNSAPISPNLPTTHQNPIKFSQQSSHFNEDILSPILSKPGQPNSPFFNTNLTPSPNANVNTTPSLHNNTFQHTLHNNINDITNHNLTNPQTPITPSLSSFPDSQSIYSTTFNQSSLFHTSMHSTTISKKSQRFQQSLPFSPVPLLTLPIAVSLQKINIKMRLYVVLVHSSELHSHLTSLLSQLLLQLRSDHQFPSTTSKSAVEQVQAILKTLNDEPRSPFEPTICIFSEDLINSTLYNTFCPQSPSSIHQQDELLSETCPWADSSDKINQNSTSAEVSSRKSSSVSADLPRFDDYLHSDQTDPQSPVSAHSEQNSTPIIQPQVPSLKKPLPYPLTDFKIKITFGGDDVASMNSSDYRLFGGNSSFSTSSTNGHNSDIFNSSSSSFNQSHAFSPATPATPTLNAFNATSATPSTKSTFKPHKIANLDAVELYVAEHVASFIHSQLSVPIVLTTRSKPDASDTLPQTSSAVKSDPAAKTSASISDQLPEAVNDFLSTLSHYADDLIAGFKTTDIRRDDGSFIPTRYPMMLGGGDFHPTTATSAINLSLQQRNVTHDDFDPFTLQ